MTRARAVVSSQARGGRRNVAVPRHHLWGEEMNTNYDAPVGRDTHAGGFDATGVVGTGRDRVRWGPIWAGLLMAIATFVVLSTIAVGIGAHTVSSGADTSDAGLAGAIVTGVIGLIAFLVGGFVASRTAAVVGRGYGALNGLLVWALGLALILGLAAMGLGSLFGASGDLFAQYRSLGAPQPDVDPNTVAEGIRNSSLGAAVGMLLPAIAAAIGGFIGARHAVVVAPAGYPE